MLDLTAAMVAMEDIALKVGLLISLVSVIKTFQKKLPKFQSCVVLKEIDFFATNFGTRCCRPLIFHIITFVREIV